MMDTVKTELMQLAQTRIAWFLLGVFISHNDVNSTLLALKAFVGA